MDSDILYQRSHSANEYWVKSSTKIQLTQWVAVGLGAIFGGFFPLFMIMISETIPFSSSPELSIMLAGISSIICLFLFGWLASVMSKKWILFFRNRFIPDSEWLAKITPQQLMLNPPNSNLGDPIIVDLLDIDSINRRIYIGEDKSRRAGGWSLSFRTGNEQDLRFKDCPGPFDYEAIKDTLIEHTYIQFNEHPTHSERSKVEPKKKKQLFLGIAFLSFIILINIDHEFNNLQTKTALMIGFGLLGIAIVINAIREVYFIFICKHWPVAKARICHCQVMYKPGDAESSDQYWVDAEVEYQVNGRYYRRSIYGDKLSQRFYLNVDHAEEFIRKITTSDLLKQVHYNPTKHDQAYIEPGINLNQLIILGIGVTLIILPFLVFYGYV